MNRTYNLNFDELCRKLMLGELLSPPEQLFGGHLHRMYAVCTSTGKYAVKALNPQVMSRPAARQSIINAENIAQIASRYIPALPAKVFDGTVIQEIDTQSYLVYDWSEGKTLNASDLTIAHCASMGRILAKLHLIDFSALHLIDDYYSAESLVNWNGYLENAEKSDAPWLELLKRHLDQLYAWNQRLIKAAAVLSNNTVISHGDLEPKNVMWHGDAPLLIDWEAAGFIHPMHDLVETALYWSADETGQPDETKFLAFISAYKRSGGMLHADWAAVLDKGLGSKLGWLEYSLRRALGIECADEAERQMGVTQIAGTIRLLLEYDRMKDAVIDWLNTTNK